MKNIFSSLLFLSLISGCVGTVQDSSVNSSFENDIPVTTFSYEGLSDARAIAHDKIEIEFYPAPGDSSQLTYELYVNETSTPTELDLKATFPGPMGQYVYTIKNLAPNSDYKLRLSAKNKIKNRISINERDLFVKTFSDEVAGFNGITKVSLVPGNTARAISVSWLPAKLVGTILATPYDTVCYEITVISNLGGSRNLNNETYKANDKKTFYAPPTCELSDISATKASPLNNPGSLEISHSFIQPETTYYVQVRARHKIWDDAYASDPANNPYSLEKNTKFLTIKTTPSENYSDFDKTAVILTNPAGNDGASKINVYWRQGKGVFVGYRIFYREYDGSGDPQTDDKMTSSVLETLNTVGTSQFFSADQNETYTKIQPPASSGKTFQIKVALCKTMSCPVNQSDPNAAIISDVKAIKVQPVLATFSGITEVDWPRTITERDRVYLKYSPPSLTAGNADGIDYYCVNPSNRSQMWKLSQTIPISGSSTVCDGLTLDGAGPTDIKTGTERAVKNIDATGLKEYCFAATPYITWSPSNIEQSATNRIVRCAFPDIRTPKISQFSGLSLGCAFNENNATVSWNTPTGGIYSNFRVFWKEKEIDDKFNFSNALLPLPSDYTYSTLASSATSYEITALTPGRTYEVGILAYAEIGADKRWSQFNTSIQECSIPLPIPTFKGFSRIVALGPKIDGRVPDLVLNQIQEKAKIYEALNSIGEPYEVTLDAPFGTPNGMNYVTSPIGNSTSPSSYTEQFDGAFSDENKAMSRDGIITLAWENVDMNYSAAVSWFNNEMVSTGTSRSSRKYGYRIYRSHDNKKTWKDISTSSGLVWPSSINLYKRPGVSESKSIAYFTDYSVKALNSNIDTTNKRFVDRARVYWYKIVPFFDGKPLSFNSLNDNIVKVTLPPANMALVHRWMSNRAQCLEMDKTPDISKNYICDYNGIGSKGKSIPFTVGKTVLDQGGDLLVDRFELGCRFTRGDPTQTPASGASRFNLPDLTSAPSTQENFWALFKGYATDATGNQQGKFMGCTGRDHMLSNGDLSAPLIDYQYDAMITVDYNKFLFGDCIGSHMAIHSIDGCGDATDFGNGAYYKINTPIPGLGKTDTTGGPELKIPCYPGSTNSDRKIEDTLGGSPSNYSGSPTFGAGNRIMQSEFMAVFHNSATRGSRIPVMGPKGLHNDFIDNGTPVSTCMINLAALDGSGYMRPRWIDGNNLAGFIKTGTNELSNGTNPEFITKTVRDIIDVGANADDGGPSNTKKLFDSKHWKVPGSTLLASPRYDLDTRIGRIYSSTSAKLPPIAQMSLNQLDSLCKTYFVQVGSATDSGTFAPEAAVASKHALRRREFLSANLWNEEVNDPTNKEKSCTSKAKTPTYLGESLEGTSPAHTPSPGKTFTPNHAFLHSGSNPALMTGSSVQDHATFNTEACVSRFGIQDLLGNLSEVAPENIFCDYTVDKIKYGPVSGGWNAPGSLENVSGGATQLDYGNILADAFWSDVSFLWNGPGGSGFEISFTEGQPSLKVDAGQIKPWVDISTESGYCSMADQTPASRGLTPKQFTDVFVWKPLFLPNGNLDTNLVSRTPKDAPSLNLYRNGDGNLLDFGTQSLLLPLARKNSLSIASADTPQSLYFNPVIGLPVRCYDKACNSDLLSGEYDDNAKITIPSLNSNLATFGVSSGDPNYPEILNFNPGNSIINNSGISDYTYDLDKEKVNNYNKNLQNIITRIEFPSPTAMINNSHSFTYVEKQSWSDLGANVDDEPEKIAIRWNVLRESVMGFYNGGDYKSNTVGRFSTNVSPVGSWGYTEAGGRCAVLINE